MKKIICFIILMTAALNIEASDFFGSGDPGGSCAGTKMAITFNYDHLTIDGNSTHQYLVDVYASNKDEKEFKAQFPSYDEYISYWNFTAIPKVQNLFIDNFVSEETNLQKENAISIHGKKLKDYKEAKVTKETKDYKEAKGSKDYKEAKVTKVTKDYKEIKEPKVSKDPKVCGCLRALNFLRALRLLLP